MGNNINGVYMGYKSSDPSTTDNCGDGWGKRILGCHTGSRYADRPPAPRL
jgi:hypothetical protein